MSKLWRWTPIIIIIAIAVSGCDLIPGIGGEPEEPPAAQMLPDLPEYTMVDSETLTGYISTLGGGAALLTGQPHIAAAIAVVDQIIGCYQEVGAAQARVYSNKENPLMAGTVAIADRDALMDPLNLFKCVAPVVIEEAGAERIEFCSGKYTLEKDDNEFYILYAGTMQEVCDTFCENLEGCTENK